MFPGLAGSLLLRAESISIDKTQKAGKLDFMKTTIDLPEALVREMKLRALQEGRKLKDVATDVFRAGLRAPKAQKGNAPYSQQLDTPVFACEESKATAPNMSVAELLRLEQRAQSEEDASRVGQAL